MASTIFLKSIKIVDGISLVVPTVGEIADVEDDYFDLVYTFVATPYDMMVQLDDIGINFSDINDFDLFILMFPTLQRRDTKMLFGDLDFSKFKLAVNQQNNQPVVIDEESGVTIDRFVHQLMCKAICDMLNIKRNDKRAGNEEARKYLLERARKRMKRAKRKPSVSHLDPYIVALVNAPECPYTYESIRNITIRQFYESLNQVVRRVHYDDTMIGVYAGTVKLDSLKSEERTWIGELKAQ